MGTDSARASSSPHSRLDQKSQKRREEAVSSTDFTHYSRKAWSTINKLSGRSRHSFRLCPVSPSSIPSQPMKKGVHKTRDSASIRLINNEVPYLWKVPTPQGDGISGPVMPDEHDTALNHLEAG